MPGSENAWSGSENAIYSSTEQEICYNVWKMQNTTISLSAAANIIKLPAVCCTCISYSAHQ